MLTYLLSQSEILQDFCCCVGYENVQFTVHPERVCLTGLGVKKGVCGQVIIQYFLSTYDF